MIINDVRLQNSETLNQKLYGQGQLKHTIFSSDLKYLTASGSVVQLYSPKFDHIPGLETQSLNKLTTLAPTSAEPIS